MFKILRITDIVELNNVNKFFKENEDYITSAQICSSVSGFQVIVNGEASVIDKISSCCEYPVKEENLDKLMP